MTAHRSRADLSLVKGPSEPPLLETTIGEAFDAAVAQWPKASALIVAHEDIRWTWSELAAQVNATAAGLIAHGLTPGDRIGIWAPNCAAWTVLQFAAAKAGLILVTINPAYRRSEFQYAMNKAGCAALVTASAYKGTDYIGVLRSFSPEDLPRLRLRVSLGETPFEGLLPFSELRSGNLSLLEGLRLSPHDAANIQFTSGTTGSPKGATLSHYNILNNGYLVGRRIRLSRDDRLCLPVPLYHCFGMVMGNLACVTHGAAMVYPAPSFDPEATLSAIARERCTSLYGVPTMFIAMLNHATFGDHDLTSLRTGIMAGSPCPSAVMSQVITRMHMSEVTIAYGMTETSPVSFQSSVDDAIDRRIATIGQVHPHIEVKIIDAHGRIVRRGESGEVCTRGYSVMLGYWNDRQKTAEVIDSEGWMHTGDLGTIDDEGYGRIVGRIKDMVIRGGENIYPREIEEVLLTHPLIIDAQVFGVSDDSYGEALCAWVMLRPQAELNEEQVRDHCRDRLAHFKIPKFVRFVDAFPMTVTGKARKIEMREHMERLLQQGGAHA